jgi:hypothetical protein
MIAAWTSPSQFVSPRRLRVIVASGTSPPTARCPRTVSCVPVSVIGNVPSVNDACGSEPVTGWVSVVEP